MKEITGDIWDYHSKGHWIVITTNGTVKANGEAVMGRGIALQVKKRWPQFPTELGRRLRFRDKVNQDRYVPFFFHFQHLVAFPVKRNWWEKADLALIENSAKRLSRIHIVADLDLRDTIYMVRPGCGAGGLDWKNVKPILEKHLDDRFVVVELGEA